MVTKSPTVEVPATTLAPEKMRTSATATRMMSCCVLFSTCRLVCSGGSWQPACSTQHSQFVSEREARPPRRRTVVLNMCFWNSATDFR